jgi:hypothetical protein
MKLRVQDDRGAMLSAQRSTRNIVQQKGDGCPSPFHY